MEDRVSRDMIILLVFDIYYIIFLLSMYSTCCYRIFYVDADAASTNIQLNLRVLPDKHCKQFRSFHQILAVMLHEITHTSIGLEDIHPPAFWELLDEIKKEYQTKLQVCSFV